MIYKPISNYHTHTYLCKHAIGKPIDYVKKAVELGYEEIAITDHGPLTDEIISNFYTRRMSYEQYYNNYLPELEEAKNFNNEIKVLKGLEIEYFENMDKNYQEFLKELDILIIGQHYFYYNGKYINVYNRLTDDEIRKYGQTVIQAMKTGYFRIIAHPEIFCYSRKWDNVCEEVAKLIIEASKKYNVYLEFNVNGIRNDKEKNRVKQENGHLNFSYPRYEFFKLVKEAGISVLINDDIHNPEYLYDENTKLAIKLADEWGLSVIKSMK